MNAPSTVQGPPGDETAAKVDFLREPGAYAEHPRAVSSRQTHMSWVFLTDHHVYKLKKPVAFPFLDYGTLERREAACREEIAVNRRLAPRVYLGVAPLTRGPAGYAVGGTGTTVDWLVVMRRLPEARLLDGAIARGTVTAGDLDRLAACLAGFYARQPRIRLSPPAHLAAWRRELARNRVALADPRLGVDQRVAMRIDRAARRFLALRGALLAARAGGGRLVDGHGDLRPEHVFLGRPVAVIDRLEFNPAFRIADPFDELALLDVECVVAGDAGIAPAVAARIARRLHDRIDPALTAFYGLNRAAMRARLVLGHILSPDSRSPEHWRPLAARYLAVAFAEALRLDGILAGRHPAPRANVSFTASAAGSPAVVLP